MKNLELRGVRKVYDNGYEAVENFNLAVEKGEFIAFLGPSGCGKSTILRMIAGFETISSGEIMINGKRINDLSAAQRPTAMIFQNYALFPHMTVRGNVAYGLDVRNLPASERDNKVDRMLDILGLTDVADRKGSALSGGQRQRVAIARALVTEPDILLLDEPLGALDANLRKAIQNELKLLQKKLGITFIFVTHAQSEALALSDRIVVMNRGKIEQIGSPHEVYTRPNSGFVARFIGRNTIFPGDISDTFGGDARLTHGGSTFVGRNIARMKPGTQAALVVPGEAFDILPVDEDPGDERYRVRGRIISAQPVGSVMRIKAETHDGLPVELEALAATLDPTLVASGTQVTLAWQAGESTIVSAKAVEN